MIPTDNLEAGAGDLVELAKAFHDGPLMADDHEFVTDSGQGKWCIEVTKFFADAFAVQLSAVTAENARLRDLHSWPQEAQFQYGDWVEKFTGEARWEGRVVSAYHTKRLALRYVVEVEPQGFQMIAVPAQLRAVLSQEAPK